MTKPLIIINYADVGSKKVNLVFLINGEFVPYNDKTLDEAKQILEVFKEDYSTWIVSPYSDMSAAYGVGLEL